MRGRGRMTRSAQLIGVVRALVIPAVLLCPGPVSAQTGAAAAPDAAKGAVAVTAPPPSATATTEAATTGDAKTEAAKSAAASEAPKSSTTKSEAPAEAQAQAPEGFTLGGFVFKAGGRIKLDVIRDFDAIGSEDSFDPRTIPTDGTEGGNSNLHAKESRLFLDIRGPVEGKELKLYFETDLYGSSGVFRLRQVYGTWGGLLAGQTWSTFIDEDNFPATIDFESPMAFPSIRQAQLRWTQKLGANSSWAVSVEDNKSTIESPTGQPGKPEYPMPDVAGRFRFGGSRGHAFVSGFLGKGRFRPTEGDPDTVTLWGMNLSGRLRTYGLDQAYTQFTFGEGVGRYRGGVTAVPDFNGELQPVGLNAWLFGYEHYWSSRWSTNAVYSVASTADEDYYSPSVNKDLDYGAANLLYWFLPKRAWAGVEYLYGRREVFDGGDGSAHRVHFAVRFNFP
jgi:hypothetical protein